MTQASPSPRPESAGDAGGASVPVSAERFRLALTSGAVTLFEQDRDLRYVWVYPGDPAFVEGHIGRTDAELLPPEDGVPLTEFKRRVLETGRGARREIRATLPREVRYYDLVVEPRRDAGGGVVGVAGAALDITERRRAEEALRESESRLSAVFRQAGAGIAQTDLAGRFVLVNARYCEIVGRGEAELLSLRMQDITHPEDLPGNLARFEAMTAGGPGFTIEKRYVRPDGSEVWIRNSVSAVHGEDGRPRYVVAVAEDIHDRKSAEEALRESEKRYRFIVESTTDAVWRFDLEEPMPVGLPPDEQIEWAYRYGVLGQCNDGMARMYGYERAGQLVGTRLADIMPREEPANVRYLREFVASGYRLVDAESRDRAADGAERIVLNNLIGILRDGHVVGAWGTSRDVTDRRRAEEALREGEEKFRTLVDAVPALVWICRPDGFLIYLNPRWVEYTGQDPRQFEGFGWADAMHPEDRPRVLAHWEHCTRTGETYVGEVRYRRRNGAYRWHFYRGVPLRDERGGIRAWYGTSLDVHDRKVAEEALRENERRFRAVFNQQFQFMAVLSPEGVVLEINELPLRAAGLSREEVVGRVFWETRFWDGLPEMRAGWPGRLAEAAQAESPVLSEDQYRAADGAVRTADAAVTAVKGAGGEVEFFIIQATDTTKRRRAERRDRLLLRLADAVRPLVDPEAISEVTARLLGEHVGADRCAYAEVEEDEDHFLLTGNWLAPGSISIVGRFAMSEFGAEVLRLMRAGQPYVVEDSASDPRTADVRGSYEATQIQSVICVPMIKSGRFSAAMAVHQRVPRRWTDEEVELVGLVANLCWESIERARVTRNLGESEERFRTLADNIAQLAWMTDETGWIFWYNRRWFEYTGTSLEQMQGWGWRAVHHPDHVARVVEKFRDCLRTGRVWEDTFPLCGADGAYRWFLSRAVPIRDARGNVLRWFGTNTDVTEQLRAQEDLRELNATLERRVAERTAQVEERNGQLRRLAAELSAAEQRERKRIALTLHDHLQQILVAAKYGVDHLRRKAADPKLGPLVEQVDRLIAESIDASRTLTVELSPPVLYDRGLGAALEWLERHFREKHGMEVAVAAESGSEPADADVQAFLFHAVRELLFNVVKHAGTKEARVAMRRGADGQVEIVVEDRGAGCEPERFLSHGDTAGGFGLFHIQQRIDLLGGRFVVESAPGGGCRVTLSAPADAPEAADDAGGEPGRQDVGGAEPSRERPSRIRVLVADDHRILREGLTGLLGMHGDIEVVGQADNGRAAVELASRLRPDVVVMDVSMPVMDGIDATRAILGERPATRVIGLSMHEQGDMAAALRDAGAAAYLTKGGPSDLLVAAIRGAPAGVLS